MLGYPKGNRKENTFSNTFIVFFAYGNFYALEYKIMEKNQSESEFSLQNRGKTLQIDLSEMQSKYTITIKIEMKLSLKIIYIFTS